MSTGIHINRTVALLACVFLCQANAYVNFAFKLEEQTQNTITSEPVASKPDNTNRFTSSLMNLLGLNAMLDAIPSNSRGPTHDTPPLPCRCRCGEINYESRIVGGKETQQNKYPWMVRLSYFGRFYCGGTLINDRYVLSAAHCVRGFVWVMIKATVGEHDRCDATNRPESRYVLEAFSQQYSVTTFDDDIALLRLNDRVPINHIIRPICLPPRGASNYAGKIGRIAGWGATSEAGDPSCVLRDVNVSIMTNLDCVRGTSYVSGMISENMMCAGYVDGQEDACQGDSGGPLIVERRDKRFEIAGIVSWGIGCARVGYPGVYTRVARYLNWIRQNTRDACYCRN